MQYLQALRLAHASLAPRNYCEIGCRHGYSLALADCPSLGIDPEFELRIPPRADRHLFEMTSDEYFARHDPAQVLGNPVDFAFIDGMHQAEYALRDFINLERAAHPDAVIAIDDTLPGEIEYASRERNTRIWTGDIYRTVLVLKELRPDLHISVYDVEMKGFCLVSKLDPRSDTLKSKLPAIERDIHDGRWSCASIEELRAKLAPVSTDQLTGDLAALAQWRNQSAAAHAS